MIRKAVIAILCAATSSVSVQADDFALSVRPMLSSNIPLTGLEEASLLNVIVGALTSEERPASVPCFNIPRAEERRNIRRRANGEVRYSERTAKSLKGAVVGDSKTCVIFARPTKVPADLGETSLQIGSEIPKGSAVRIPTVEEYIRAGTSLADLYCSEYFRRASHDTKYRNFTRNTINDLGSLVTALFGFSTGEGAITGGLAALTGFADKTARSFDDNFLVTSDLPGLRDLVLARQAAWRQTLYKKDLSDFPTDFPDATRLVREYGEICSFIGMKALVSKAVSVHAVNEGADPAAKLAQLQQQITQLETDNKALKAAATIAQETAKQDNDGVAQAEAAAKLDEANDRAAKITEGQNKLKSLAKDPPPSETPSNR